MVAKDRPIMGLRRTRKFNSAGSSAVEPLLNRVLFFSPSHAALCYEFSRLSVNYLVVNRKITIRRCIVRGHAPSVDSRFVLVGPPTPPRSLSGLLVRSSVALQLALPPLPSLSSLLGRSPTSSVALSPLGSLSASSIAISPPGRVVLTVG